MVFIAMRLDDINKGINERKKKEVHGMSPKYSNVKRLGGQQNPQKTRGVYCLIEIK